jgi:hypothetical protein
LFEGTLTNVSICSPKKIVIFGNKPYNEGFSGGFQQKLDLNENNTQSDRAIYIRINQRQIKNQMYG